MRVNLPDCMPPFRGALGLYLGRDGRWDVDSDSHRAWGGPFTLGAPRRRHTPRQ